MSASFMRSINERNALIVYAVHWGIQWYEKLNKNSRIRENKAQRTTRKYRGWSTSQRSDHSVCRGQRRGWQLLRRQKWQWVLKDGRGLDRRKRTIGGRYKQKPKAKVWGRGHPPLWASPSHRRQSKGTSSLAFNAVTAGEFALVFLFSNQISWQTTHASLLSGGNGVKHQVGKTLAPGRVETHDRPCQGGNYQPNEIARTSGETGKGR